MSAKSQPLAAPKIRQTNLLSLVLLAGLVIVLFTPVLLFVITLTLDYGAHLDFIDRLLTQGGVREFIARVPHLLFHVLVMAVYTLVPNLGADAFSVALLLYIGLALTIYHVLGMFLGKPATLNATLFYVAVTCMMMLVMPVNLFTPGNTYHGYIATNVYHNPTMVALKPLAVWLFGLVASMWNVAPVRLSFRRWLLYTSITVLCIIAKPSYILILLPALVILALHALLRHRPFDWRLPVLGIMLPAVIVLALQMFLFDPSGIIIAPLKFFIEQKAVDGLFAKLLLSILFPSGVYIFYFKQAHRSPYLNLAWLSFVFGLGFTYILVEATRPDQGNLTWSGQIGAFILFLASLIFWLKENHILSFADLRHARLTPAFVTTSVFLVLHLVSGIVWYLAYARGTIPRP